MSLSKHFKLGAAVKPKTNHPILLRRQKFIAATEKQLAALYDDVSVQKPKSNWIWQSEEGDWFISPRYGKAVLELSEGMTSIKCSDEQDVIKNLEKLKAFAADGKLDDVLNKVASAIRTRFGR